MVDIFKQSNENGGGSDFESAVVGHSNLELNVNGVTHETETGYWGMGGDSLLTYKRRKFGKDTKSGKNSDDSVSQPGEKPTKHLHDLAECIQEDIDALRTSSNDFTLKLERNIILEQICNSLDSEGGLKKCIQKELMFQPGNNSGMTVKESVRSSDNRSKSSSLTGVLQDGLHNAAKSYMGMTTSASINESNDSILTELCCRTFVDIFMSEKFAQLCSLLLENFEGMKAEKLFDLNHINTRMREEAYVKSTLLFQADVQKIWMKLHKVGTDITVLAKWLSDKTATSFREQVGTSAQSISEGGKNEFLRHETDPQTKVELTEACVLDKSHTCKCCQEKADGRSGLICDSCEKMYHISCIEPPVKEIPTRSWFCANCIAKGAESSHENCIACERLNAYRSSIDGSGGEDEFVSNESVEELEESSNELVANEGGKSYQNCKVCSTEVSCLQEEYRICGHSFCPHKFYHVRCLTTKQLISYGTCWYCPSCLCRGCLTDRDDDKIVLCDGCDHAYHIYCMHPPRSTIPKGKWFCQKCCSGIQRIHRARSAYEKMQHGSTKRGLDGKLKGSEGLNKSGGVDMLLNAAQTLNYEENLAAMGVKKLE